MARLSPSVGQMHAPSSANMIDAVHAGSQNPWGCCTANMQLNLRLMYCACGFHAVHSTPRGYSGLGVVWAPVVLTCM